MVQKVYAFERRVIKAKPPKPKAWSHDDELKAHIGRPIDILISFAGSQRRYMLLQADRYVLVLFDEVEKSTVTVYKHAITGYRLVTE